MLFGFVVFRDRRARLHRVRHQPVVGEFERHHIGGLAEGVLDRGLVAERPVVDHIARRFRMQLRRARLDRRANIGDRRQFLVSTTTASAASLLFLVSAITTATAWPTKRTVSGAIAGHAPIFIGVPSLEVMAQPQIRLPILSSTISCPVSTPTTPGIFIAAEIDALYLGVGVRAADEMGMGHALKLDVVDVAALAGDETPVFLAHHACANAFNAHGLILPTGVFVCHFASKPAIEIGVGLAVFRRLRNLHAAGGIQHRLDDVVIAGAAADIAFQLLADGLFVEIAAMAVHDIDRRHDHARRAIAALQSVIVAERGLHRMCSSPFEIPSMVVTLDPSACPTSTVQDLTARPSIWTTQAPHWLVSQPTWVPVRFR